MTDKPMTDAEALRLIRVALRQVEIEDNDQLWFDAQAGYDHLSARLAQQPARGGEVASALVGKLVADLADAYGNPDESPYEEALALIANMAGFLRLEGDDRATPLIEHADRILAQPRTEQPAAEGRGEHRRTGVPDNKGREICVGDRIVYRNESNNTKREYWNPEYIVRWKAPRFVLEHDGGGKDSSSPHFAFDTCVKDRSWGEKIETLIAATPPRADAEVDEESVFRLACWMAEKDGHDDVHHLIWEGSPPEPWGEVWHRYEADARAALAAAINQGDK